LFASEYGWTEKYILEEVSFYSFLMLSKQLQKRKKQDALLDLAIVSNPHVPNPKELIYNLQEKDDSDSIDTTYDREGLNNLKSLMSQGRGFQVR